MLDGPSPSSPPVCALGELPPLGEAQTRGAADGIDCPGFAFARPQLFPRILFLLIGEFFEAGEAIGNGILEEIGDQQYACSNQRAFRRTGAKVNQNKTRKQG